MSHAHTNELIRETSPYLLQHAHNPVHWHTWGPAALALAEKEQKPILLSIGYSACHWCHVMERESFENKEIADLMNRHYINIKVDREERPDLDQIYQMAVQMFTGRGGGWPLTMFLTPEGKPFYGGTYFPPQDRHNLPGFPKVLTALAEAYREKPDEVQKATSQIINGLNSIAAFKPSEEDLSRQGVAQAAQFLLRHIDPVHGGMGGAPKFPQAGVLSLLLRYHRLSEDETALNHVKLSLRKMAEGGMYDHLGGGFHRYSVDNHWLVPHFEKMLYDNSQLITLYLEAYQATENPFFKQVAEECLAYVQREMTDSKGGFYSTQDADSEGVEGKFFVWTPDQVVEVLGEETARLFCRAYDITEGGNFEGKNIPHTGLSPETLSQEFQQTPEEIKEILSEAKKKLFLVREKRIKPFRDEKILTSWNALMISAAAQAYKILGKTLYLEISVRATDFILTHLYQDGLLLRTHKDGQSKLKGYLDDYAFFIAALLDMYEATADLKYLNQAETLSDTLIEQFWDEVGGFFFTGTDHDTLITRTKSSMDHSIPSGNSVAILDLLRLYFYTGKTDFLNRGEQALKVFDQSLKDNPFAHAALAAALDFYTEGPKEIVVVGKRDSQAVQERLRQIYTLYLPNKTVTVADPNNPLETHLPAETAKNLQQTNPPSVFVCQNFTCSLPLMEWETLKEQLIVQGNK